jgi:hypothetical protein
VTDTPTVSVIIVSWNALPLLRKCLPSVAATEWPGLEVVLADNGSDDGSAEWVEAQLPGVRIVRHPENWGFCRGNNEAIRQTTSEFVVLLNNDVEVTAGWLAPLVERMQGDPTIGAVQPKLLAYDDRGRFEYAGAGGGYLDRWGYPFARGRIFFTLEEDRGQYDRSTDVFWGSGAALMLRRDALGQVGLLDERFGFHMEEIDLCWRLHRAGWRVVAEPASVVYHVGGGSLPRGHPRKTYLNFRNSLLMLYKNLSPRAWRRVLPVRAVLDLAAAVRSLVTGAPRDAWAIVRAYAAAHRMKRAYRGKRAGEGEPFPAYRGSIVVDYFLRGRRRFSDLPADRFDMPG